MSGDSTTVDSRDLGEQEIEGLRAHGVRWTLKYDETQDGKTVNRTRIHEVWVAKEMELIVRVIDGDPYGEETIWGIEKVSVAPDSALFRPPEGYFYDQGPCGTNPMRWFMRDFEFLQEWFTK